MVSATKTVAEGSTDVASKLATAAVRVAAWLMPSDDTGRNLRPLPHDLAPELRDLALFLRVNFAKLGVSVRGYAQQHNWDPSVVSRFLKGERIPDQTFVDALLADAGPQRSREEVEEQRSRALDLRLKALRVRNTRAAKAEELAQELIAAEEELNLLKNKERALARALRKAEEDHSLLLGQYACMEQRI